jgi:hypothetical protein
VDRRQKSEAEALNFASSRGLSLEQIDSDKGQYCGSIVFCAERHFVLNTGRDTAVVHDVQCLQQNAHMRRESCPVKHCSIGR